MGLRHVFAVLLNPFCPFSKAKVLSLKATVQIAAGSALVITLLSLQTLVFLPVSGGLQLLESDPWLLMLPWRCCSVMVAG
jgi:hypothetical protein